MDSITTYQKVWCSGQNADVITIKKEIMRLLNIKRGQIIQVTIKTIEQPNNTKEQEITLKTPEPNKKTGLFNRRE